MQRGLEEQKSSGWNHGKYLSQRSILPAKFNNTHDMHGWHGNAIRRRDGARRLQRMLSRILLRWSDGELGRFFGDGVGESPVRCGKILSACECEWNRLHRRTLLPPVDVRRRNGDGRHPSLAVPTRTICRRDEPRNLRRVHCRSILSLATNEIGTHLPKGIFLSKGLYSASSVQARILQWSYRFHY